MAELTVRFDLSFGTGSLRGIMAAGMLFCAATEVASESMTLTTYYPAPSGVYSQMITTGNTYLARDQASTLGRVGIGTTAPALLFHEVYTTNASLGVNWAALIQSTNGGNTASAYFAHAGGYGAYIDAGLAAGAGTYALDVNRNGVPYLYVRGDGYTGIGTAAPTHTLDVAGGEGNYGYLPHYSAWNTYGVGDGGAALYNDAGAYQALMIVGNNSKGGERRVNIYDSLLVNGPIATVDAGCSEIQFNINGADKFCNPGQYVTMTSGIIADMTEEPLYSITYTGGTAPMLCCTCPASGCPSLP